MTGPAPDIAMSFWLGEPSEASIRMLGFDPFILVTVKPNEAGDGLDVSTETGGAEMTLVDLREMLSALVDTLDEHLEGLT